MLYGYILWSYWGLNPRPSAHKTDTLPTELYDHNGLEFYKIDAVSLTLTALAVYSHFRMSVSF